MLSESLGGVMIQTRPMFHTISCIDVNLLLCVCVCVCVCVIIVCDWLLCGKVW